VRGLWESRPLKIVERLGGRLCEFFNRPEVWEVVEKTADWLVHDRDIRGDELACQLKDELRLPLTLAEAELLSAIRKTGDSQE
jgi:hypothetical protein